MHGFWFSVVDESWTCATLLRTPVHRLGVTPPTALEQRLSNWIKNCSLTAIGNSRFTSVSASGTQIAIELGYLFDGRTIAGSRTCEHHLLIVSAAPRCSRDLMRTSLCSCGNRLFFRNHTCLNCGAPVVFCPCCWTTSDAAGDGTGKYVCQNPECGASLRLCKNSTEHQVCGGAVPYEDTDESLCPYCRLNTVIPDLSDEKNLSLWRSMEEAKHRVLAGMRLAGFPVDQEGDSELPLRFAFRSEAVEPVTTGHADGLITLRLEEADSVEREQLRRQLNEPKRTLTAHFRHEIGHYVWQRAVQPKRLNDFRKFFGDEAKPPYAEALKAYYNNGPAANWANRFVSAYSSMHPWEDFAETFRVYMEMDAMIQTGLDQELVTEIHDDIDERIKQFLTLAVASNEMSRELGLIDLIPEKFPEPVMNKLRFIDSLRAEFVD